MAAFEPFSVDPTAFMTGQIWSKLWLCETLEDVHKPIGPQIMWVLAGWYCVTNLLLRARGALPLGHTKSFDADPAATQGAMMFNEAFQQQGAFSAETLDINTLDYTGWGSPPNIVINTAVEHIDSKAWFDLIPEGTLVILQSNDMEHDDHVFTMNHQNDLAETFPLSDYRFVGTKTFDYGTWGFRRFMTIGTK